MFVPLIVGILDLETGKLKLCNAGHNPVSYTHLQVIKMLHFVTIQFACTDQFPETTQVIYVNDAMLDDILHAMRTHACNLGCLIASELDRRIRQRE